MKYISLLFLLTASYLVKGHDIPVANFSLLENEQILELEMEFDQKDLVQAVTKGQTQANKSIRNNLIKQYLLQHISIKINGVVSSIKILKFEERGHHFFIKAKLKKTSDSIKRIDFKTNILINEIEDQNNVLIADVNCVSRGFRLTKKRQAITIMY